MGLSVGLWIMIWMIVLIVAVVVEVVTNAFLSIWFIASALVMAAVNVVFYYAGAAPLVWYVQALIFLLLSTALLFSFRPLVMKKVIRKPPRTNADRNIGETGVVIKTIVPHGSGLVKVSGQEWSAFSDEEEPIETGVNVRVVEIRGVKLKVEKV